VIEAILSDTIATPREQNGKRMIDIYERSRTPKKLLARSLGYLVNFPYRKPHHE